MANDGPRNRTIQVAGGGVAHIAAALDSARAGHVLCRGVDENWPISG